MASRNSFWLSSNALAGKPHVASLRVAASLHSHANKVQTQRSRAMGVDLTGGLSDCREYGFAEYPDTPDMRDSVNFWFCDDQGRFGMPRCVMEATGPNWQDDREATVNIAFPDGRVYSLRDIRCKGPASNKGPDGRPTIF